KIDNSRKPARPARRASRWLRKPTSWPICLALLLVQRGRKSPVGRETLDDGGRNGNRILADRRIYHSRGRLRLCSATEEAQLGSAARAAHVGRGAGPNRTGHPFAGAKKIL